MKFIPACLAAVAMLSAASLATAHPRPKASVPAPDAVLSASPPEIRITFSEALVAAFSGIELKDAAGRAVGVGPARLDPANHALLIVAVRARLAPGAYTVSWHAVGDDTHHTAGQFGFRIKP